MFLRTFVYVCAGILAGRDVLLQLLSTQGRLHCFVELGGFLSQVLRHTVSLQFGLVPALIVQFQVQKPCQPRCCYFARAKVDLNEILPAASAVGVRGPGQVIELSIELFLSRQVLPNQSRVKVRQRQDEVTENEAVNPKEKAVDFGDEYVLLFLDLVRHERHHHAHESHPHDEAGQVRDKGVKDPVVPLADARAKPHTVVVKSLHAIVAHVAVACPWGAENPTRFTKFELVSEGRVDVVHVHKSHFRVFAHVVVLVGQAAFTDGPGTARDDAGVPGCTAPTLHRRGDLQVNQD